MGLEYGLASIPFRVSCFCVGRAFLYRLDGFKLFQFEKEGLIMFRFFGLMILLLAGFAVAAPEANAQLFRPVFGGFRAANVNVSRSYQSSGYTCKNGVCYPNATYQRDVSVSRGVPTFSVLKPAPSAGLILAAPAAVEAAPAPPNTDMEDVKRAIYMLNKRLEEAEAREEFRKRSGPSAGASTEPAPMPTADDVKPTTSPAEVSPPENASSLVAAPMAPAAPDDVAFPPKP